MTELKPFDLTKCQAGHPVVTANGLPYKFGGYNPDAADGYQLLGWLVTDQPLDKSVFHRSDGVSLVPQFQLFMAPNIREGWLNICKVTNTSKRWVGITEDCELYGSEAEAKQHAPTHAGYMTTVKVEWEE